MPTSDDPRASRARRLWLVLTGALLAFFAWLSWPTGDAPPPAPTDHPSEPIGGDERGAAEVPRAMPRKSAVDEPPLPTVEYPEADLEHPFRFVLDVRLLDAFALPVAGAMIFLAPPMCGFALWPERSDARGHVRLDWRGREPAMEVEVAVMAWGVLQPIRMLRVEAGPPRKLAFAVQAREHTAEVQEYIGERDDRRLRRDVQKVWRARKRSGGMVRTDELDVLCGRTQLLFRTFDCLNCHDSSRVARYSTLARAAEMAPGLHPASWFRDLRGRALTREQLEERRKALATGRKAAKEGPPRLGEVYGIVRHANGNGAIGVPVVWRRTDGAVLARTTTGNGGRYRLERLGIGPIELVAGGGSDGVASALVVTSRGQRTAWNCQLELTSVVTGTARDEQAEALTGWRVEFERAEGDWAALATTDRNGRFRFAGVPGTGQCLLWSQNGDSSLPVVYDQSALIGAPPLALKLDADVPSRARVRIHVALPAGHKRDRVDARLYQLETGRVVSMPAFGFEDAFEVTGVPAGLYRVQLGAPGIGWVTTGIVAIDGRGLWDLGSLHLPAPARVRLRLAPGATSPLAGQHAIYRRTPAVDVKVEYLKTDDGDLLLPVGQHVLLWRDPSGLRSLMFTVYGAGSIELPVPPPR